MDRRYADAGLLLLLSFPALSWVAVGPNVTRREDGSRRVPRSDGRADHSFEVGLARLGLQCWSTPSSDRVGSWPQLPTRVRAGIRFRPTTQPPRRGPGCVHRALRLQEAHRPVANVGGDLSVCAAPRIGLGASNHPLDPSGPRLERRRDDRAAHVWTFCTLPQPLPILRSSAQASGPRTPLDEHFSKPVLSSVGSFDRPAKL